MERLKARQRPVRSLSYAADGTTLAVSDTAGHISIWDTHLARRLAELSRGVSDYPSAAISKGRLVATTAGVVWRNEGAAPTQVDELPHAATAMCLSRTGHLLLGSPDAPWVEGRDLTTGRELEKIQLSQGVFALATSADGNVVAVAGARGGITLWQRAAGKLIARFPTLEAGPVAVSPDGETVAWGDGSAVLLHLRRSGQTVRLAGHVNRVTGLAFSPDGRTLASVGQDEFAALWSIAARQQVLLLPGLHPGARAVTFAPDGRTLAAGLSDGTVVLWRARPAE